MRLRSQFEMQIDVRSDHTVKGMARPPEPSSYDSEDLSEDERLAEAEKQFALLLEERARQNDRCGNRQPTGKSLSQVE